MASWRLMRESFSATPVRSASQPRSLMIGANLAVSGAETIDFITGIVGIDLMGDDHGPVMYDYLKESPEQKALREAVYGPQNPPRKPAPAPPAADRKPSPPPADLSRKPDADVKPPVPAGPPAVEDEAVQDGNGKVVKIPAPPANK